MHVNPPSLNRPPDLVSGKLYAVKERYAVRLFESIAMLSAYVQRGGSNESYSATIASSFIKLKSDILEGDFAFSYYDHWLQRSVRLIRPCEKFMVLERLPCLAVALKSITSDLRSKQVFPYSVLFGETTGIIYFEYPSIVGNFELFEVGEVGGRKPL